MDIPDSHFKTPSGTDNNKNNNTNNSSKLINPSSSDSTAVQDSPIYNFISNLSPIQPVKAAPVAQGFPGLASPPLIFASPRISSQTSFLNRQLRSPIPDSTFSEHNYKCQNKEDHPDDLANLNLNLKSPSAGGDKTSYSRKSSVEAAPFRASGFRDELFANPMECTDSSIRKLFADSPQSSRGHCLEQKDNTAMEDKSLDGSAMPRVTENAQTKTTTSVKLVKLEPKRMISASSGGCRIFTRLSSGHPSEASNLESGSLRRCLFDENQRKYMSDGSGSRSAKDEFMSIQEVANTSSGTVEASQIVSLSKPMTGVSPSPTARNYPVAISKPLGIGLHLNSVVYPRSLDNATGGQQSSEIVARETRKTSMFVASIQPAGKVNISSVPSNSVGEVPSCSEQTQQNQAFSVTASDNPLASDAAENMKDLILVKTDDPPAMLNDKRKFNSEPVEPNMLNLGSPRKKRKKLTTPPDDDSSKRCNCRRSKCLKLYCDCFAAGMYCGESCACQGCSNRSEYEHTVLETRQQIESRNPLAFAPKVVQPVIDSHSSGKEVENFSTPSSARHKRGCNCKRSMCLKKYCECYQSNVGCSDGCRCEGCKNVYGKREDYTFPREFMTKKVDNETQGGLIDEKQQSFSANSDNTKTRIHSSPQVTPVTPALQCSDQRKNALKSQLSFQRFLRSPDSNHDVPSKDFSARPENSPIHSMLLEDSGRSMDVSSSKPNDLRNVSGPQTSAGSGLPPSSSHLCSRSSPKTPITESGRPEFIPEIGSGSKRYSQMVEDETPEILKDSVTPSESVKVRSPNKKRVSPPCNHNKASSDSLRICQKFVLHAVSSLQPLTPLSRKSNNENPSEPID